MIKRSCLRLLCTSLGRSLCDGRHPLQPPKLLSLTQKTAGRTQMFHCHPKTEQLKAEFLDFLYEQSGRTSGLYTGLWREHCLRAGEEARNAWIELRNF